MIGLSLLFTGFAVAMVIINIPDTTPPVWLTTTDGSISLSPKQGDIVTPSLKIVAGVGDPESGVTSVVATVDTTAYNLVLTTGSAQSGIWFSPVFTLSVGSHTIKYVATNGQGLTLTAYGGGSGGSGAFTVYTALAGNWYVNEILITSATQVITATSTTVTFKFVKTSGIADSSITAFVKEGSTTLVTLTTGMAGTPAGTWTGSYTFGYGTHTLSLVASDGTNSVTMSVFGIDFGSEGLEWPQFNSSQIYNLVSMGIGLPLMGIGLALILMGKKH